MGTPQRNIKDPYESLLDSFEKSAEPARPKNRYGAYDANTEGEWSISDAPKVKGWYRQNYGRDLPVNAFGQSRTHNRMGLDHANSMDVGLNPTSAEGQAFVSYLKQSNIPYLAYDRAVRNGATGPHIHVGYPSHKGRAGTNPHRQEDLYDSLLTNLEKQQPDEYDKLLDAATANQPSNPATTLPSATGATGETLPLQPPTPLPAPTFEPQLTVPSALDAQAQVAELRRPTPRAVRAPQRGVRPTLPRRESVTSSADTDVRLEPETPLSEPSLKPFDILKDKDIPAQAAIGANVLATPAPEYSNKTFEPVTVRVEGPPDLSAINDAIMDKLGPGWKALGQKFRAETGNEPLAQGFEALRAQHGKSPAGDVEYVTVTARPSSDLIDAFKAYAEGGLAGYYARVGASGATREAEAARFLEEQKNKGYLSRVGQDITTGVAKTAQASAHYLEQLKRIHEGEDPTIPNANTRTIEQARSTMPEYETLPGLIGGEGIEALGALARMHSIPGVGAPLQQYLENVDRGPEGALKAAAAVAAMQAAGLGADKIAKLAELSPAQRQVLQRFVQAETQSGFAAAEGAKGGELIKSAVSGGLFPVGRGERRASEPTAPRIAPTERTARQSYLDMPDVPVRTLEAPRVVKAETGISEAVPTLESPARPAQAREATPTEARQKFQHRDFGLVEVAESQSGVPQGKVRVVSTVDGSEHVIQKANGRGQGNSLAVPVRETRITEGVSDVRGDVGDVGGGVDSAAPIRAGGDRVVEPSAARAQNARDIPSIRTDAPDRLTAPVPDAKAFREQMKSKFRLSDEQADAVTAIAEARASAWAKENGKDASEYYAARFGGIVRGGEAAEGALHQSANEAPTFYSQAQKVVEGIRQERMRPEQMRAMLDKGGVKAEEMKWTGLDDFIAQKAGKGEAVTKSEALEFLRQNEVKVEEVVKGEPHDDEVAAWWNDEGGANEETPFRDLSATERAEAIERYRDEVAQYEEDGTHTKFSQYTLPGAKEGSYRELLLTLPTKHHDFARSMLEKYGDDWVYKMTPAEEAHKDALFDKSSEQYISSHFDEPNILAHVRFNERTDAEGKRVLFVEEIQSDWHQQGRKKGYGEAPEYQRLKAELDAAKARQREVASRRNAADEEFNRVGDEYSAIVKSLSEHMPLRERSKIANDRIREKISKASAELDAANKAFAEAEGVTRAAQTAVYQAESQKGVPDAPFKKNWHELAMKRVLRYAAENGYDRVAWTKGDTQAERYDLRKHVDSIDWVKDADGTYSVLAAKDSQRVLRKQGQTPSDLENLIGKELAQRIVDDAANGKGHGSLTGDSLKVGGEGMKGFYDKILPSFAQKYGRKWGARVGEGEVPTAKVKSKEERQSLVTPEVLRRAAELAEADGHKDYARSLREEAGKVEAGKPLFYSYAEPGMAVAEYVGRVVDFNGVTTERAHSIDITPQMRDSVMREGQPLFQSNKAAVEFMQDGRAVIRAFKQADVSSAWHEMAHVFRRDLPENLRRDAEEALSVKDGKWSREHDERFARGFERYLKTGEAPTVKLRRVFEAAKQWLTEIYGAIRGKNHPLNFKPNPELISVFDRMLGGEPKGEYGQLIHQLHKAPEEGTPAFFENAQVKRALRLKPDASATDVRWALADAVGKPRSSHLSPDDLTKWADSKGIGGAARKALDFAVGKYNEKAAGMAVVVSIPQGVELSPAEQSKARYVYEGDAASADSPLRDAQGSEYYKRGGLWYQRNPEGQGFGAGWRTITDPQFATKIEKWSKGLERPESLAPAESLADNDPQFIEDFYAGKVSEAEFIRRAKEAGLDRKEIRAALTDARDARKAASRPAVPESVPGSAPAPVESSAVEPTLRIPAAVNRAARRPVDVAQPTKAEAKQSVKVEKVNARTGLTSTQTDYLAGELQRRVPEFGKEVGRNITIKVPGDGEFQLKNREAANKLHQKITGNPIEGFEKVKGATVPRLTTPAGLTAKERANANTDVGVVIRAYGGPERALNALRAQKELYERDPEAAEQIGGNTYRVDELIRGIQEHVDANRSIEEVRAPLAAQVNARISAHAAFKDLKATIDRMRQRKWRGDKAGFAKDTASLEPDYYLDFTPPDYSTAPAKRINELQRQIRQDEDLPLTRGFGLRRNYGTDWFAVERQMKADSPDVLYQSSESEVLRRFREATAKARGEVKRQERLRSQIEELDRKIAEKDLSRPVPRQRRQPTDPTTQALIAERDLLKKNLAEMRRRAEETPELEQPKRGGALDTVSNVANAIRALNATGEVSFLLRQGGVGFATHPIVSARATRQSLRALFASKPEHQQIESRLRMHVDYDLAKRSGLELTESSSKEGSAKAGREEDFQSAFVGRMPVVRNIEQATTTFLNAQRLGIFSKYAETLKKAGAKESDFKEAARLVNYATGRGDLGRFNQHAPVLTTVLFSPRYTASRFQLLNKLYNPTEYFSYKGESRAGRLDPRNYEMKGTAKIQLAEATKYAAVMLGTMYLASQAGATVSTDPEDPNFGKVKWGNYSYDITSGNQTTVRFLLRAAKALKRHATGEEAAKDKDVLELAWNFLKTKAAPGVRTGYEVIKGEDLVTGKKTTPVYDRTGEKESTLLKAITPIFARELWQSMSRDGFMGLGSAAPSAVGVSVSDERDFQRPRTGRNPRARTTRARTATR